ncbi:MAG: DNA helicase RecQ [Desulfitobacteriaceae bacterium]|nr:DNA helicase RecQ [Desulfitobacteriaceae bacterium]MDD4346699.1 DNA helicase RecQ [Desulfitobacteriaceae bacterium]MDD4401204.1 DNA helicase RecQ [Desulfitobacteriaceae bacterium]
MTEINLTIKKAQQILQKYFGYTQFREGQHQVIASLLQGADTLAIMPTGAGKSLAYQIPALLFKGTTLVISPLISLMKDQVDALQQYGIAATFINSSLSPKEVWSRLERVRNGEFKLLYAAPERLESENFRDLLATLQISFLAIDEAHCVSQWGHDFRPSYLHLGAFIKALPKQPLIGAFTATATDEVKTDIIRLLGLNQPNVFMTGFDRPNLKFTVLRGENKKTFVLNYVQSSGQSGIVYAATRKEVDNLHKLLTAKGLKAGKYHAGMNNDDRQKNQENFLFDKTPIIIATNAFGMGIDKSNVRYVIHYNMPKNMEAYYQEAGRAGRDGEPGECVLLFSSQDVILQRLLIEQTILHPERRDNGLKKLMTMVDYCHTGGCLRKEILEYFGEKNISTECGNCSNCLDDREEIDITIEAQKIFSCIYRMGERFGISIIAEVLKGSRNKKILELRFNELSTHALMKEVPLQEIKNQINYLVAEDYLRLSGGVYPTVKLRSKAVLVLKDEARVTQKVTLQPTRKDSEVLSLFDRLRTLRKDTAHKENLPPYMVFADSTLREMAQLCPETKPALLGISGIGERKLEKYGEVFLEEIRKFLKEKDIQKENQQSREISKSEEHLEKPAERPPERARGKFREMCAEKSTVNKKPSHLKTYLLYQKGYSLIEIAKSREIALQTVQQHLIRCNLEGHTVPWDNFIPDKQEQLILEAIRQADGEKLRPIKELLPENVEWFTIRAVLEKYRGLGS